MMTLSELGPLGWVTLGLMVCYAVGAVYANGKREHAKAAYRIGWAVLLEVTLLGMTLGG